MHGAVRCAPLTLPTYLSALLVTNHPASDHRTVGCHEAYMFLGTWQSPDVTAISPSEQQHRVIDAEDPSIPSYITSQPCTTRLKGVDRYRVWYEHVVTHTDNTGLVHHGWMKWVLPSAYGQEEAMMTGRAESPAPSHGRATRSGTGTMSGVPLRAYPSRPASAATHLAGRDSDGPEPRSVQSRQGARAGKQLNSNHRGPPALPRPSPSAAPGPESDGADACQPASQQLPRPM